MKKAIFFAVAFIGLSLSSMANNIDDLVTKTRVNVSNGVETVVTQKTFTAVVDLMSNVENTNRVLEIAFGKKAKECVSETECTFDYKKGNNTARLLVNKVNNTMILITKNAI